MTHSLTRIFISNQIHYKLIRMLRPSTLYEFMKDGKKCSSFLGKLNDLPENDEQNEELLDMFEEEVDTNFWNNELERQLQYTTHLFIAYHSTYEWYLRYKDLMINTLEWNLEHQAILARESNENPTIINEPWYSISRNLTINVQRITSKYFAAVNLIKDCRDIVHKYMTSAERAFVEKNTIIVPNEFISKKILSDYKVASKKSAIKLKWNGNKRVLYDLFAQLTLRDIEPGQGLIGNSIKELAQFLHENVEGFPATETIEREIEKMREPNGIEKAKRGRIDLHITRDFS